MNKKRQRTQINKRRNEKGEVTTYTTEIQKIVRNYYEWLYDKKLYNLGKMDKFLDTYNLQKLNQEESLTRLMTHETEAAIKNSQHTKALDQRVSQVNFTEHLKKN